MNDERGDPPSPKPPRVELRLPGLVGLTLTGSVDDPSGTLPVSVKEEVYRDLRRIAVAPTKLVAEVLDGLVRLVRIITLGQVRRRERTSARRTRAEALLRLQQIVQAHNGQIVERDGGFYVLFPMGTDTEGGALPPHLPPEILQLRAPRQDETED